jgi:hypothetical protein
LQASSSRRTIGIQCGAEERWLLLGEKGESSMTATQLFLQTDVHCHQVHVPNHIPQ